MNELSLTVAARADSVQPERSVTVFLATRAGLHRLRQPRNTFGRLHKCGEPAVRCPVSDDTFLCGAFFPRMSWWIGACVGVVARKSEATICARSVSSAYTATARVMKREMQEVSRDAGHAHPLNWKLRQPNRPRTSACRRQLRLALSPTQPPPPSRYGAVHTASALRCARTTDSACPSASALSVSESSCRVR